MANRTVTLDTSRGVIKFELYDDLAPKTAKNFSDIAATGFYNGKTFHRYVAGFVIQGGCPNGTGTGDYTNPATGRKQTVDLEVFPQLKHDAAGVVAMARSNDPNSASCQFYITLAPRPILTWATRFSGA